MTFEADSSFLCFEFDSGIIQLGTWNGELACVQSVPGSAVSTQLTSQSVAPSCLSYS
jgi:hypothetical protein